MKAAAKAKKQAIPESLIYEMVDGKPIYYKGYKAYLSGEKPLEHIMGTSTLQSFLSTKLAMLIGIFLEKDYFILSNELGLQFSKKSWRAADIAVIKKTALPSLDNKYLNTPPEYVIEIDTKAELSEIKDSFGYYQDKTEALLQFGVQQVVWIFTETGKVLVAKNGQKSWALSDWDQDIEIVSGLPVNIYQLLRANGMKT